MEGVQNFDYGVAIVLTDAREYVLARPIKAIRVNGPFTITKGVKNVESCDDGYLVLDVYGNPHAMHHREFEATYQQAAAVVGETNLNQAPPPAEGSPDDPDDPSGL